MKRAFRVLSLSPLLLAAPAAASPSFKQAPGSDKGGGDGGGGGFEMNFDLGLAEDERLQPILQFLGDYYGYLGVVFVVLVLFLFARGSGAEDAREADDGSDDDFFEPADAERFRKPR
jgi:hypothetical protein